MFQRLGAVVSRHWLAVLVVWAAVAVGVDLLAPRWDDVTQDGDFAYLPDEMTSVVGERLLGAAFPGGAAKSQVVLIVARGDGRLRGDDYEIVDRLVDRFSPAAIEQAAADDPRRTILAVWDYHSDVVGDKLVSPVGYGGQAALVVLQLRGELMAIGNMPLLEMIHAALDEVRASPDFPEGLELGVTGSAAIGADMLLAAEQSIRNTERATIILVVVILLLVYRAVGLVAVPLAAITVSFVVAIDLLAMLAGAAQESSWFDFKVFKTTKIFIIVVLFGSGTDYCLFLIARYREEYQRGKPAAVALSDALGGVGRALLASALTTVVGLGTMVMADFGKFRNGGPAVALCLLVTLAACLTLAPALLRAGGRAVFWPLLPPPAVAGLPRTEDRPSPIVAALADAILARPGWILAATLVALLPIAALGVAPRITYDLLSELRADRPSVAGTRLLRQHFLAGATAPVTVLAVVDAGGLDTRAGEDRISRLTRLLYEWEVVEPDGTRSRPILSVRSLTEPLGDPPGGFNPLSAAGRRKLMALKYPKTVATYLAQEPPYAGRVARFDLIFRHDPFSAESVALLGEVERLLDQLSSGTLDRWPNQLPAGWDRQLLADWRGASFFLTGVTAGIRDLERVTRSDQQLLERLVVIAVLAVLVVIMRRPWICVFLVLSVLLGYFVTIGTAALVFSLVQGADYHGLDWKVPIFLFVLLVALGADYNIYLTTRVFEEQRRLGPRQGLREAMLRTSGIITSCGVIMAGTFASMLTGTLSAMQQLGFSLAFGVLLDTMLIRTVLVPALLAIAASRTAQGGAAEPERCAAADQCAGAMASAETEADECEPCEGSPRPHRPGSIRQGV